MKPKMTLYTGLDSKLLFSSMKQNFECPISTTLSWQKALSFCDDNGIILKLKAANCRTRYFDVSWLSGHKDEEERLIMGSSLEICDIYVNGQSVKNVFGKHVFSAFSLFERLTSGQFIKNDLDAERTLFALLTNTMAPTDAMLSRSQYITDLFANLVKEMQRRYKMGKLWWSRQEILKLQHEPLRELFNDPQQYVSQFQMSPTDTPIRWVKQYEWRIDGLDYERFNKSQPRQYLISDQEYRYNGPMAMISFKLECCAKYSEESDKTALFLHITQMQPHVRSVLIGYDILCDGLGKHKNYEHSIMPQWMQKNKLHCGLQLFSSKRLTETSITWKIALRIIDVKYEKQKSFP
uniref:Uncharacterized protein n=1 Tax=Elphidium margaritaceum TaxID=933848 RepID=A0A7S0TCG4_9EUKA